MNVKPIYFKHKFTPPDCEGWYSIIFLDDSKDVVGWATSQVPQNRDAVMSFVKETDKDQLETNAESSALKEQYRLNPKPSPLYLVDEEEVPKELKEYCYELIHSLKQQNNETD